MGLLAEVVSAKETKERAKGLEAKQECGMPQEDFQGGGNG